MFKSFFTKTKKEGNNTFFQNQSSQNADWRRCFYPCGQIGRFYHPFFCFRQIRLGLYQTASLDKTLFLGKMLLDFIVKKRDKIILVFRIFFLDNTFTRKSQKGISKIGFNIFQRFVSNRITFFWNHSFIVNLLESYHIQETQQVTTWNE